MLHAAVMVYLEKPEAIYNKTAENIELLSELQFEILESASQVLKDEGELVYSTCTILKRRKHRKYKEIFKNIQNLKQQKYIFLKNVKGTYDEVGGFTIDYNEDILDGFYIAKLEKEVKMLKN